MVQVDVQGGEVTSESMSTPASDLRRQTSIAQGSDVHVNDSDDSGVSDVEENGYGTNRTRTKKPRSSHACQACRRMKIRCEPLDDRDSCKQCSKVNRECITSAPRRKRQKTVHRVSELEKKIDALTASLTAKESADSSNWNGPSPVDRSTSANSTLVEESNARLSEEYSRARSDGTSGHRKIEQEKKPYVDVIDRGIIDEKTAYRAFHRYRTEMSHYFPVVVFPAATTAQDIRSKRPFLFLAILTGAISTFRPQMQAVLCDELTIILAERILYRGERSLELVQTLLVLMLFYSRPKHHTELNFNQIIHVAATMALDLGMGRRSKKGVFQEKPLFPGVTVAETRRTWLGCYYMCANAAMSLRHPIFIRWSAYIDESLDYLSKSPEALPSDTWFCELIRLQHIAEEVAFLFSMDDPAVSVSLTETKTQYHLKTFERQMNQWRQNATIDLNLPWVRHIVGTLDLYIHEIAIHFDHNVDDFRPPPHMANEAAAQIDDFITPAHIDSLIICMESIHKTFDAFLEMDTDTIRNLPNLYFVRNAYAAVALIKMDGVLQSKGSKFGSIFSPNLKIDVYIDTIIDVLSKAAEGDRSIVAFGFGFVFRRLKSWYTTKQSVGDECCPASSQATDQHEQPLDNTMKEGSKSFLTTYSSGTETTPAPFGPTSANQDALWGAQHLGMPQFPDYEIAGINDTTMFNLGLPQLYDFGFTFNDIGLVTDGQNDPGWMGFAMS